MARPSWNKSYASGQLPWDSGEPEPLLVEFVTSGGVTPTPTLEIGGGTGTNSIWLAERGFDVLGVDVSPLAVEGLRSNWRNVLCVVASPRWIFSPRFRPTVRFNSCSTAVAFTSSTNQAKDSDSQHKLLPHSRRAGCG